MSERVPEGWEVKRLDEYCYRVTDGTHDSPKRTNEGVRLVTSKNLKRGKLDFSSAYLISHTDFAEIEKRSKVDAGDVLFGMIGTIGNPVIVKDLSTPFAIKNVALFKFKGDLTKARWLQFYLDSNEFKLYVERSQTGNAQSFLGLGFLRETLLPVPPLPEQKKIASILTSVDQVIETTQKQIDKLQDLKKATMNELLTKGIGHTEFKDSELGQIPKSWDVKSIGDFVQDYKGGAALTPSDFADSGFPVIPKKSVQFGGKIILGSNRTFCQKQFADANGSHIIDRQYVIATLRDLVPSGPSIGLMGVLNQDEQFILAQGVYGFRLSEGLSKSFLSYLSNTDGYRLFMRRLMVGSTQVHIRTGEFLDTKIPAPSLAEQLEISTVVDGYENLIKSKTKRLNKQTALKKSLMQDLLTGKVRVHVN